MLLNFNPRSPHGERHGERGADVYLLAFQSTLPARGATPVLMAAARGTDISIHAPRTGSDEISALAPSDREISIHAPRTGSDTLRITSRWLTSWISTHAPRTGSDDCAVRAASKAAWDFNPRSPHGEQQQGIGTTSITKLFQPTLPARGATDDAAIILSDTPDFNPRSPHGERLVSA